MIACSDIIAYLNDNYKYVKSLSELSNNERKAQKKWFIDY